MKHLIRNLSVKAGLTVVHSSKESIVMEKK